MERTIELYKESLIYVFRKNQLKKADGYEYLAIIKDGYPIENIDNCLTLHYHDDFESLLNFTLPTKNRKVKQLITLFDCLQILDKVDYGVLSFSCNDIPYSVGLNHIIIDDRIFFHCAKKGYKLNSIDRKATFIVIEDLGVNKEIGTHNHNSVSIFGTVKRVTDQSMKKLALLQLVNNLAPKHPYNDKMLEFTEVLELIPDYIIGKTHIR